MKLIYLTFHEFFWPGLLYIFWPAVYFHEFFGFCYFRREGQMPQSLTMIQIHKVTPVPSVLVITLMSLAYLTSSNIIQLMNYVGFDTWLAIGVAVFCVIYLRFKYPDWERPIKVCFELNYFKI